MGEDIMVPGGEQAGAQANDPEVKKLADLTRDMVDAGMEVTKALAWQWSSGLDYLFGNQLANKLRKDGWEKVAVQMNTLFPASKQKMAIISQRNVKVVCKPHTAKDAEKAKFWSRQLQARHDRTLEERGVKLRALLDGEIGGTYVSKTYDEDRVLWDDKAHKWTREPRTVVLHPLSFGMDPNAESEEDAQFMFCRRRVPTQWAVERWPEHKEEILRAAKEGTGEDDLLADLPVDGDLQTYKADTQKGTAAPESLDGRLVSFLRRIRGKTLPSTTTRAAGGSGVEDDPRASTVVITEVYFRDYETIKVKETAKYSQEELVASGACELVSTNPADPAAQQVLVVLDPEAREFESMKKRPVAGQPLNRYEWPEMVVREDEEPKFPYGRMVLKINEYILNPKPEDQVWEYELWPFAVGVNLPLPHVWQGMNSVEMPRGVQDWINVAASKFLNWLMNSADCVDVVEKGALVGGALAKLKAGFGRVVMVAKNRLGSYRREPAPPLSQGIIQIYHTMVSKAQDLVGMHDQDIGAAGKKDMTAFQVQTINTNTQLGMGIQTKLFDLWMVKVLKRIAMFDRKRLEPGEMVRVAGDAAAPMVEEFRDEWRDVDMDIDIEVSRAMPYDQQLKKLEARELFEVSGGTPLALKNLLNAYEVSNPDEWVNEIAQYREFLQLKAQAEEQARLAARQGAVPEPAGNPPAQIGA